VLNSN
jgi:hypothetical protein